MGLHTRRTYAPLHNPPNPFHGTEVEWEVPPPDVPIQVIEERPKTILAHNDSPDVGFDWSVNPYRGCQHGCIYCYARPSHEYWDMSAGRDFERKIIVKVNAPELLDRELRTKRRWKGDVIAFSGNTDCYQPLEAEWQLTRRCLEVCARFRNPIGIVTKSHLITRDLDILAELHRTAAVSVLVSIAFLDPELARVMDPFAPAPTRRFETIARLREAGIPVGVFVAPIIPGLNDADIPRILALAAEAGAERVGYSCLRLPKTLLEVFESALRERLPLRADRVLKRIHEVHGGKMSEWRFGARMCGTGTYWDNIYRLIQVHARRLGLDAERPDPVLNTFRVPTAQQEFSFDA